MDRSIMFDANYYGYFEQSRIIQVPGAPHEHEVRIWLPPTYRHTDRAYPTLWITDNFLEVAHSALLCSMNGVNPELIVVSIGAPHATTSYRDFVARRSWDFFPEEKWFIPGMLAMLGNPTIGGGNAFRDYLIDVLRPELARDYRMDPADHCLFGHSGGGLFSSYCLFTRPEGFAKYMASSGFGLNYQNLAQEYLSTRSDIAARAYLAAGGAEGPMAEVGLDNLVAILEKPSYRSLEIKSSIIPGMDHFTILPAMMMEGVRWLWRETLVGDAWMQIMTEELTENPNV